jgi:Zn-dependent protease
MSREQIVLKIFEYVILLFALSLHEAAHAWMASRLGDQTARMLGRVTLNPGKHIDILGTVVIPLFMLFMPGYGQFLIGWAKPTPVNNRNFKHFRRDDILTTLAGPGSNILAAIACLIVLIGIAISGPTGAFAVHALASGQWGIAFMHGASILFPVALIFYISVWLNLMLCIFNLLPVPPLDGSHVFRHMLPYNWLRYYDSIGIMGLVLILFLGGPVIEFFLSPALTVVNFILLRV